MRSAIITLSMVIILGASALMTSKFLVASNPKSVFSALVSETGVSIERDIAYGAHDRQKFDIYRPVEGTADAVVLFLYGGGWTSGERSTYGFVGAALASRGFTTVIPDYRLHPQVGFPDFVRDAARAYVSTVKSVAQGRPVYLMGHSAGAHMAALLAYDDRYLAAAGDTVPRPAGLVGLAGPYAFDPTTWPSTKAIFSEVANADDARPVTFVDDAAPPTLVMHGLDDDVVRLWNMHRLVEALRGAGVTVRQRELEGLGHIGIVLALARPFRWRNGVLDDVIAFLHDPQRKRRLH